MDLTRLSELLDLADNTALAPYQARELADEMAQLRAATEWTATTPTQPSSWGSSRVDWQAKTSLDCNRALFGGHRQRVTCLRQAQSDFQAIVELLQQRW
jgi:hypothetical protein